MTFFGTRYFVHLLTEWGFSQHRIRKSINPFYITSLGPGGSDNILRTVVQTYSTAPPGESQGTL